MKIQKNNPITKDQVTIVIPVKNEEQAISLVIDELIQEGYSNILVVDGYSADNTIQIIEAKKSVTLIQQHGKGKTGAVKTAIENVTTPYLLILDGDYTYQAKDIQRLLNHCANYAQVIGVRDRKNIGLIHRFGNWVITKSFNLLMSTHFSDLCSGMYVLRTDVARSLELGSRGFATEVEIAAQTVSDYEVTEVPIGYRQRLGKAKLSWKNGFGILSTVVSLARKYNPVLLFSIASMTSIIPAVALLAWVLYRQMVFGIWHSGWALMGVMLLLFASQALAVVTLVLLVKRTEKRIIQRLEKTKKRPIFRENYL
ncbi:MAG: glycosyltransferase family 2 protein [Candidatus Bathyarchaeota archaeon]|nr:glycosyltransferase family 2 protein [Candidatus Bathyarchaeota archaeon]